MGYFVAPPKIAQPLGWITRKSNPLEALNAKETR
jgi:hypothetical protein